MFLLFYELLLNNNVKAGKKKATLSKFSSPEINSRVSLERDLTLPNQKKMSFSHFLQPVHERSSAGPVSSGKHCDPGNRMKNSGFLKPTPLPYKEGRKEKLSPLKRQRYDKLREPVAEQGTECIKLAPCSADSKTYLRNRLSRAGHGEEHGALSASLHLTPRELRILW